MTQKFLFFAPAIIWACIIFMLSTNTPVDIGPVNWLDFISIDKVGHLVFYSIFCVLVCWGLFKNNFIGKKVAVSKLILPIMIVITYGVIMEFLQLKFYEGRQLEFMDMIANSIGAILGAFVFKKFYVAKL